MVLCRRGASSGATDSSSGAAVELEPLVDGSDAHIQDEAKPAVFSKTAEAQQPATALGDSFLAAKHAILTLLGAVYAFAFLGAWYQNGALLGDNGLSPARPPFEQLQTASGGSLLDGFMAHPSLFWFVPMTDRTMELTAVVGLVLSLLVCAGLHSSVAMLALWLLDFTIVTSADGTAFYQYGWESQLLETGFLAIFLPLLSSRASQPATAVLWLFRWLAFRISLGAGLIKIRGGSCWEARTCLHYHFETQPVPSPLSFFFHFLPKPVLSAAVDLDLLVQLYAAPLLLVPDYGYPLLRWGRRVGGAMQVGFMLNVCASGNFAFLNHLTIVPALACLDDACFPRLLRPARPPPTPPSARSLVRRALDAARAASHLALVLTVACLSWPVVANLMQLGGRHQVMNSSFGSFRIVNTYGAFGSVGEARYEPIISVSHDGRVWHELDFPCKPGTLTRRPCFCAPYHYRLDWNIWFIGFKPHQQMLQQREGWLFAMVAKLLAADDAALSLLDASAAAGPAFADPDHAGKRRWPRYGKVEMWRYKMAAPLWKLGAQALLAPSEPLTWWQRDFEEPLVPVVRLGASGRLERAPGLQEAPQ